MADPTAAEQMALLTQLVAQLAQARITPQRPKAVNCRMYKLGQSWPVFSTHFSATIKATYNFNLPADEDALAAACCNWLPSKLEPGPTLVAYQSLDDATKDDWDALRDALGIAFDDDTERESFLADVASFRRGDKGLVEYKNELLRRIGLYQPDLAQVPTEYQRQAVARFIEGLDSIELKRKLRKHCKRDKLNVEEAFNYAVDTEAADLQTKLREGDAAAAFSEQSFASANLPASEAKPKEVLNRSDDGTSRQIRGIQEEVQSLHAKQKITEMQINELTARAALTDDRIMIVSKEVGQVAVNVAKLESTVDKRLSNIESLIRANQSGNTGGHSYNNQNGFSNVQYRRPSNFGGQGGLPYNQLPRPQYQSRLPSLTGGVGYVNNQVRPSHYRMLGPQVNIPVRPSSSIVTTSSTNSPSMAVFGAVGSSSSTPNAEPVFAAIAASAFDPNAEDARHQQQQQQFDSHASEAASWWSPGMNLNTATSASAYDEPMGTWAYGQEDFWQQ